MIECDGLDVQEAHCLEIDLFVDQKDRWRDFRWWLVWVRLLCWFAGHERAVCRFEDFVDSLEVIETMLVDLIAKFTWQMQEGEDLSHRLHLSASDSAKA
jgi:hypothetical protein